MKKIENIIERFKSLNKNKKFIYLFVTLFFKTIINFLLLFYVAKVVTVSDFGSFTLSFVIMTIGILLIDYGYNLHSLVFNYDDKDEVANSITSIISGKIFLSIALIILFFPLFWYSELPFDIKKVILVLSISAIPNSFGNFFFSLFKAKDLYRIETIGYMFQGFSLIIFILLNHYIGTVDIITISVFILFSKIIYFIYSYIKFKSEFKVKFKLSFNNAIKSYKNSFNYGVHLIFGTLILYVETFFLSYFSDMESVGYYQSGLRLVMAASLFGAIITDGFVPEIARKLNEKQFVTNRMVNLFNFLGVFYFLVLLTLGLYFNTIINILFSSKFEHIENYSIYILLIILFRAFGIVPGIILTSLGLQKIRAKAVMYSCFLSIILNFLLIPYYGLEGAFISFLLTNLLLNFIYVYFSIKEINFIKVIVPNMALVLFVYLLIQYLFSMDNILYLFISAIINLLILFFLQKSLKKNNVYHTN